jgi:hypothetical protein
MGRISFSRSAAAAVCAAVMLAAAACGASSSSSGGAPRAATSGTAGSAVSTSAPASTSPPAQASSPAAANSGGGYSSVSSSMSGEPTLAIKCQVLPATPGQAAPNYKLWLYDPSHQGIGVQDVTITFQPGNVVDNDSLAYDKFTTPGPYGQTESDVPITVEQTGTTVATNYPGVWTGSGYPSTCTVTSYN